MNVCRGLLPCLLLFALLLPLGAAGRLVHLCRAMDAVRTTCCCGHTEQPRNDEPSVEPDCCDTRATSAHADVATPTAPVSVQMAAIAWVDWTVPELRDVRDAPGLSRPRARGPPARTAIFLENCSLLI